MPVALINKESASGTCLVTVYLSMNVDSEFLFQFWPPVKELASELQGKEIKFGMSAFSRVEARQIEPFLNKFLERGFFRLDIGRLTLDKVKERLWSTDLRCYKDGYPDPEYTRVIH